MKGFNFIMVKWNCRANDDDLEFIIFLKQKIDL